jgi:hypothetical protein
MYYLNFSLADLSYVDEFGETKIERWVPIPDFEGQYEISDLGRVKSLNRTASNNHVIPTKILKQRIQKYGYLVVSLRKPNVCYIPYVHKLVVQGFVPNPEQKPEGNHKKGNKLDNRASELEWATKSENISHSFRVLEEG